MIRGWLLLALSAATAGAVELDVTIVSPRPGNPIFGEVVFEAEVYPTDAVDSVELFIDGESVGLLSTPPFRLELDLGGRNREHRFEVVARGHDGASASALLVTPAIRVDEEVDAELQQLYVTVRDEERRVLDLTAEDFVIVDSGQRQEMVTFARGDVRLTAVLLVDASASMRGERLRHAVQGASAFVRGMRPDDEASIVLFSDRLLHATTFSNDHRQLTDGLERVSADGGTALNDHTYLALKRLERQQGRRVVILLSDGFDSHSVLRMPEVTWLARQSRALLYWIRTDPDGDADLNRYSAWKNPDRYREEYELLDATVWESGGRVVTVGRIEDAEGAFREILAELREQYVLGYYPSNALNDGRWHPVSVRVRPRGLRVRTRGGYIDY